MTSSFVISLDFELFWGVTDSKSLKAYKRNISGEWDAIPRILNLFKMHRINSTWACVGMAMCRDYAHWNSIRPEQLPTYEDQRLSAYSYASLAMENPTLFFGRSLVDRIVQTPGQEIAGHSYSHFYCNAPGASAMQFSYDLDCAGHIASDIGLKLSSFVFPRNQYGQDSLDVLVEHGYRVYRGNPQNSLYANGHHVPGGLLGKFCRFADSYIPLTGSLISNSSDANALANCPASFFLRPWSPCTNILEPLRLQRLKNSMLAAAQSGGVFHIWWHPHNFGINIDENLSVLNQLIDYYRILRDRYGMQSLCMRDFS